MQSGPLPNNSAGLEVNVLDDVAVASLVPIARAVEFSGDTLELNTYTLNTIRDRAPRSVVEVLDALESREPRRVGGGFGLPPRTSAALKIARELDALKLGTIARGPYMMLLDLAWAPYSGQVNDQRRFGDLRVAVRNAEQAFRALEQDYPWGALGPEDLMISSWREFAFAGFQDLIHSAEPVPRFRFLDYITLSLLKDFEAIMDRVEAKAEKKVRLAQRRAVTRMLVMTGLSFGIGAAVAGPALAGVLKLSLGQVDKVAQAKTAKSLEDLVSEFQADHSPFAAEIQRTADSLKSQAGPIALPHDEAASQVTPTGADAASPVAGHGGGGPSKPAETDAVATAPLTLIDRIIAAIRRIFGGLQ